MGQRTLADVGCPAFVFVVKNPGQFALKIGQHGFHVSAFFLGDADQERDQPQAIPDGVVGAGDPWPVVGTQEDLEVGGELYP